MVNSTSRPHFTPGKDPVPILQNAGWAPGSVWTEGKSNPHWDSIPDHPSRSQSLYRLSYRPTQQKDTLKKLIPALKISYFNHQLYMFVLVLFVSSLIFQFVFVFRHIVTACCVLQCCVTLISEHRPSSILNVI